MSQIETEKLTEMLISASLSRAMCSVAELGIADLIESGSPQSVASLAAATGAHERSLYRILRFLASHGLFCEIDSQKFAHTPLSLVLRSDAEGSFRSACRFVHRMFAGWDGLHHSVLTGEPAFNEVYGKPIFEYVALHPDMGPILDAGMTSIHGYETAAMLEAYSFADASVLADIGGGNGSLISAVLQHYPELKGILFDLDHVVARARPKLHDTGVADRCTVIEGSFFETVPAGADTYLFRHIIHDWTDELSIRILSHCRKVIPDDGRLLIVETVVPGGNDPSIAKDFDILMMAFPGGIERTKEEYSALVSEAGFEMTSVTPTPSMVSVIESKPT